MTEDHTQLHEYASQGTVGREHPVGGTRGQDHDAPGRGPRAPYSLDMRAVGGRISDYPKVKSPTLVVYGREDVPLVVEVVDVRLSRTFIVGRLKIKALVDAFNALNCSTALTWNTNYGTTGAAWLTPRSIVSGRIVKFGAQVDF